MNLPRQSSDVRTMVDRWPVEHSGLNPRVVHCMASAGVPTIGELRQWKDNQLMQLRHFGIASLNNVKWFFRLTRRLERGDFHQFPDIKSLMKEFLNDQEIYVLERRYGLTDPLFRPHMRRRTLQSIADEMGGMTRERVRQVEEQGLYNLRSRLCGEFLRHIESHWVNDIQARGEVITNEELGEWVDDPRLAGYQPWGVMLLVSEMSDSIDLHFDYFSTLTPKALGRMEQRIIEVLREANNLVPLDRIKQELAGTISDPQGHMHHVLQVVLGHHPDICGTREGYYFLPAAGTPVVIQDIFRHADQPLHFRDLTTRYNERMLPSSRKGAGFVLRMLNLMPEVQRVDRAVYQLAPV